MMKRPEMKLANTKVSEKDMIYFSLGLDSEDYILPSERDNYKSDARAVKLVQDIEAGKDLSGQDFSGINLKGADISNGNFAGSSFKGAIFYETTAKGANFENCDFSEAYFEKSDFSKTNLTGAQFQKTFLRNLNVDNAEVDGELRKRLTTMEFLIQKIESGEIDIHCLTKSELMCLDLRRLDMSKVDVSDIDLSMFNLEGVNLCGVYINPLQRLSMEHWQKDLLVVEKLQEKKLKEEVLRVMRHHQKELETYAKQHTKIEPVKTKNIKRPTFKQDEFAPVLSVKTTVKPDEKPTQETLARKIKEHIRPVQPKQKKHKNRT